MEEAWDMDDVADKYKVRYIPTIVKTDREGVNRHYGERVLSEYELSEWKE